MRLLISKLHTIYQSWSNQFIGNNETESFLAFVIRIGSVLFLYVVFDRILMRITHLPIERYYEPFIFFSFLKYVATRWYVVFPLILIVGIVLIRKQLLFSWSEIPKGKSVRILVLTAAFILAWFFGTYNYNLFFDQGYYLDRFLLFAFLVLIYWRPIFVVPFLTILLPFIWQTNVLEGYSWAALFLPMRILILFGSFLTLYFVTKKFIASDFVFMVGCLIAAHYWIAGFYKVTWSWIRYDQVYLLLPATYANGWLGFLNIESISTLTRTLSFFNFPMKIWTLLVEVGALFFFVNRRTSRLFLCGWMFFHTGIFFVSGIFFWMWMVIEATLLYLLLKKDGFAELKIFTTKHLVVSSILICTGVFWCKPIVLAWFDVPVTYTYRFEAQTTDGETHILPPKFFAPYDHQFTLGAFQTLNTEPILPITWGVVTSPKLASDLREISSKEQLFQYEQTEGTVFFNKKRKEKFEDFIKQFVQNWNKQYSNEIWLFYLQPPRLLLTYPTTTNSLEQTKPIDRIKIVQVMSFFDEDSYREVRKRTVGEISIPQQ